MKNIQPYMRDLMDKFEQLIQDSSLNFNPTYTSDANEVECFYKIPEALWYAAKEVTDEFDLEDYWYQFGWHTDDHKIYIGILGDCNVEFYQDQDIPKEVHDKIVKICKKCFIDAGGIV